MCMCVSERRPSMPVLGYEGPRWWLQEIHWYRPGSFLSPYINSSSREEASRRIHIAYGISAFVYWDLNSCRRLDQDGVRGDRSIDADGVQRGPRKRPASPLLLATLYPSKGINAPSSSIQYYGDMHRGPSCRSDRYYRGRIHRIDIRYYVSSILREWVRSQLKWSFTGRLFGITIVQAYRYFTDYSDDRWVLKLIVRSFVRISRKFGSWYFVLETWQVAVLWYVNSSF